MDPKDDPNYIGATNWATLQNQYTPYQLEQATTRKPNASGGNDIFWNPSVSISNIPAAEPLKPPAAEPPPSSSITSNAPPITYPEASSNRATFDAINAASEQYLTGLTKQIDDLKKTQQASQATQAEEQKGVVEGLKNKVSTFMGLTPRQDARKAQEDRFQVDAQIKTLTDIQQKISSETDALNQGMIYEESRPVRATLIQGRSYELQKQGLARIQSLQSQAAIVNKNIDLAKSFADGWAADAAADIADQKSALETLLNLESSRLITLEKDEKDTIASRMAALDAEATRLQTNKDSIFELMKTYPDSATKAGVTFLDTPEEAIAKMAPFLSETERLTLEKLRADLAATNRSNRSGGSGSGTGGVPTTLDDMSLQAIAAAYEAGLSADDAIRGLQKILNRALTTNEVDYVQNYFTTQVKPTPDKPLTISDLKDLGEGFEPGGHPEYIGKTISEIQSMRQQAKPWENPVKWYNPFTWIR
ncbi:MAG: hypothetical protein WC477_07255 [Patescibacteria group bacterium]